MSVLGDFGVRFAHQHAGRSFPGARSTAHSAFWECFVSGRGLLAAERASPHFGIPLQQSNTICFPTRRTPAMRLFSSVSTISVAGDFSGSRLGPQPDRLNHVAGDALRQSAGNGFYFGEFRHEGFSLRQSSLAGRRTTGLRISSNNPRIEYRWPLAKKCNPVSLPIPPGRVSLSVHISALSAYPSNSVLA